MSKIMLNDVRLSYAQALYEPQQFQGAGDFAWNCHFILDPVKHAKTILEIEEDMKAEFRKKCGDKWEAKWNNLAWDDVPLRDGEKKPDSEGYDGMKFLAARATKGKNAKPLVMNRNRQPVEPGQDGAPYGGAYVNGQVEIWGQYSAYKRVNATLMAVQFVRKGDAFGGGAPADVGDFEDLGDQGEDENELSDLA